ncbi:protein neprosin isoform X1 [Arachis hypogaea]
MKKVYSHCNNHHHHKQFNTRTRTRQHNHHSHSHSQYQNIRLQNLLLLHSLLLIIVTPALCNVHQPLLNLKSNNQTLRSNLELLKLRRIRAHLAKINKPALKTIQSPDGDLIDCVLSHQQPAFDHPNLRGQRPLDPPERPKRYKNKNNEKIEMKSFQVWSDSGEECPNGTIPIRRTKEEDVLRASSIRRFGRKPSHVRRDSTHNGHEHAVVFVNGDQYYGAKANINVWTPRVTDQYEFSLSQIWVIAGSFGFDLNTIEAGWQVSPELYGDSNPRFFTYWTDPRHGHWWLEFGSGLLVGYWPATMFSHLRSHASMVQFGGEIVNSRSRGYHTGTQMGSGHFAGEGFRKAAYFRNLQIVDWDNNLLPLSNIHQLADHSNCYDIRQGSNNVWGHYFYYGGPGRNVRCP